MEVHVTHRETGTTCLVDVDGDDTVGSLIARIASCMFDDAGVASQVGHGKGAVLRRIGCDEPLGERGTPVSETLLDIDEELELETGPIMAPLKIFDCDARGLAVSQCGSRLATLSESGIRVWATQTADLLWHDQQATACYTAHFSPSGLYLAAPAGAAVFVWSVFSGERVQSIRGHKGAVEAARFTRCSGYVISASRDNQLHLCDVQTGACVRAFIGHTGKVWDVDVGESVAMSVSSDYTVRGWSLGVGKKKSRKQKPVYTTKFSEPMARVAVDCDTAVASSGEAVVLLSVAGGVPIRTFHVKVEAFCYLRGYLVGCPAIKYPLKVVNIATGKSFTSPRRGPFAVTACGGWLFEALPDYVKARPWEFPE
eukprot:TRINITY_DN4271_c0_g1_i1.p1 TRINITY_DN4271_c0_g1~~TRINITY_DN4271_c0_g1_i1.p1  ORF type:complete len:369 (+),score=82.93 TRINITY_DN4271_c0_g1_i1:103-1209(+)